MAGIIRTQSVTEQVADYLAQQIIHEDLKGGDRIQEQPWADKLGVSRGSVREALLLLERRHLVTIEPRKGAHVVRLDARRGREIAEAWFLVLGAVLGELRSVHQMTGMGELNALMARMRECQRARELEGFYAASMELAMTAARISGHRVFERLLEALMPAARRCFHFILTHAPEEDVRTLEFAEALVDAVENGDIEQAQVTLNVFAEHEIARLESVLNSKD